MSLGPLPPARKAMALAVVALALTLASSPAQGGATPLALGEVTTRITRQDVDVRGAFRTALETELSQVDLKGARRQERLIVSASLVRLDTETKQGRTQTTCVVSATLRQGRGGALVAILQGRARAEDAARQAPSNELAAIRAAVRSAVRGIPKAVRD